MLEKKRERKKEMFLCRMRVLLNDESTKRVRDGNDFLRNVRPVITEARASKGGGEQAR